jgi:flagellar hook-associated protein 3 FlgL
MGTIFRVTDGNIATNTLDNLQLSLQAMQNLQNQESSGKKITKPSDDPTGTAEAMAYRAQQARVTQYNSNSQDALGWLGMAENTMQTSISDVTRVQTLVSEGANATSDSSSRQALSDEIGTIKQSLIGLANTTYNNRSIFAGTANPAGLTPPKAAYDTDGTYNGNTGAVNRTVGPGASVQINFDGPSVFGTTNTSTGQQSLFDLLSTVQSHLTSSNPADQAKLTSAYTDANGNSVPSDIDQLNAAMQTIQNKESEAGARYDRVTAMQTQANSSLDNIKTQLSNTEDIDLPSTIVALQLQSTAYQAALSATAKVIQPSLVSFLQ